MKLFSFFLLIFVALLATGCEPAEKEKAIQSVVSGIEKSLPKTKTIVKTKVRDIVSPVRSEVENEEPITSESDFLDAGVNVLSPTQEDIELPDMGEAQRQLKANKEILRNARARLRYISRLEKSSTRAEEIRIMRKHIEGLKKNINEYVNTSAIHAM